MPVGCVSQTLLCFTVEQAFPNRGFQAHKRVNEPVNKSMSQNEAGLTSSETITGYLEPSMMLIGYERVSTDDQNLALQHDALQSADCEKSSRTR